ncbi:MAG: aquaporin [Bacteroidales bacterium]|nr:aquaporin [Bacteroidales bacterium]
MKSTYSTFIGEVIGTFILVFIGTASVAVSILFNAFAGLFQIAFIWGIGVTLAIYVSRHLSCAHFNPAVSLAMVAAKRMNLKHLPLYWAGQFIGAIIAALFVFLLFNESIANFETLNNITRGSDASIKTAMMFGEYFPNPGVPNNHLTATAAMFAEGFGTFLLVIVIFFLTEGCNIGKPSNNIVPIFIGATITVLICLIAPMTQAGFNPARDFGPRVIAYFAGWNNIAFGLSAIKTSLVYIWSPLIGGLLGGLFFRFIIEKIMGKLEKSNCQ